MSALANIRVGVVVDRIKAANPWVDYVWQPSAVLPGEPDMPAWTQLSSDDERVRFYAGGATLELFPGSAEHYRDNLLGDCALWVVLSPVANDPPYEIARVTADPNEGEGFAIAGDHVIDVVAMPPQIREALENFVAEHYVERTFYKRERKRADPEALARHGPIQDGTDERKR